MISGSRKIDTAAYMTLLAYYRSAEAMEAAQAGEELVSIYSSRWTEEKCSGRYYVSFFLGR